MMMTLAKASLVLAALFLSSSPASGDNDGSQTTPLDEFVYSQESLDQYSYYDSASYAFSDVNQFTGVGFTVLVANMTSGLWLTEDEVGPRSEWWHVLLVIVPDNVRPEYDGRAAIHVCGVTFNDGDGMPDRNNTNLVVASTYATGIGIPYGVLYSVPNAPVVFASDPEQRERTEDAIVAYSWAEYLADMDRPDRNVYLPMVRAAVRAMDTFTDFYKLNYGVDVNEFFITGESKRGWTSWLTGAVENGPMGRGRVSAIIPGVWDGIHLDAIFHHQYKSYGGWSWAIVDYVENGIPIYLDSPEMDTFLDLIDPYHYRTRLTMPKLVYTGLMDEFQMADDEQFWFDDVPAADDIGDGPNAWLIKAPNTEHAYVTGFGTSVPVVGTWMTYLLNGWQIPYLTWDYDAETGDVVVTPHGGEVFSAQQWSAVSCSTDKRDFRIANLDNPCECGPVTGDFCVALGSLWHQEKLDLSEDGTYVGRMDPPADGRWGAFVVNVQMTTADVADDDPMHNVFTRRQTDNPGEPTPRWPYTPPGVFEFTSRASVVPDTFPHEDCSQETCELILV